MALPQTQKKPIWLPQDPDNTNAAKFMNYVNKKHGLQLRSYADLHQWSVGQESFQDFWRDAYIFLELAPPGTKDVGRMLGDKNPKNVPMFPPPRFFPTDKLNVAECLLRNGADDDVVIHFAREGAKDLERVTWRQLRSRTRAMQDALINSGVVAEDVVAAVISNSVDSIVICLAALSIGAIWSSASCELGVGAVVDRFTQVKPKVVFADDGYRYGGKQIDLGASIREWSHKIGGSESGLRDVVVIPYCKTNVDMSEIKHGTTLESFLARGSGQKLDFAYLPFSHPAFILYSSGTTGAPKCIVHSTGGVLLKVRSDVFLQHDVRPDDVLFQFTTTAWVMWVLNFINVGSGGSLLLYDGSPFHPTPDVLLKLAQDVGVSVFGTSPRYLAELRNRGIVPRKQFDLSRLRSLTSTGSVLSDDLYEWFYETAFPPSAQLISMSGGTDICGCFVCGSSLLPVYVGEIQAKALGMAIEIFDSSREDPVSVEQLGQPGELVCTKPFPSQPLAFYGKDGFKKYRSSYFERFGPNVWVQSDFMRSEPDTGGLVILGRSDGVLNPSGVRFGSSEIYAVTETMADIDDSICVGQRRSRDQDERVLLFVKMKSGASLKPDLVARLKQAIREKYSRRHVPRYIFQVADIPYTINGKKCEINVKQIVSGQSTAVSGTVANPQSLEEYKQYLDLPVDGAPDSKAIKSNL